MVLALGSMLALGLLATGTVRAAGRVARSDASNAFVRVVHAAPFDEHVDVFVNNGAQPLLTGFTFSNVSDYLPVAAGTVSIQVVPTGQAKSKAVISQSIRAQAGTFYTVAIIGDSNTQPGLVVFTDGTSVPADKSVLRVYNLSSDAGPISVSSGGKTVITRLAFKSASDYMTFSPNQSIFTVTVPNSRNVTLDAAFEPNMVSSVFALGLTTIVDSIGFKLVRKPT